MIATKTKDEGADIVIINLHIFRPKVSDFFYTLRYFLLHHLFFHPTTSLDPETQLHFEKMKLTSSCSHVLLLLLQGASVISAQSLSGCHSHGSVEYEPIDPRATIFRS